MPVILISADLGFGPTQTVFAANGVNTTLAESITTAVSTKASAVSDTVNTGQTVFAANGVTTTMAESAVTAVSINNQVVSETVNTGQTVQAAITYGYTDGTPITVGNAVAATTTQSWYMG